LTGKPGGSRCCRNSRSLLNCLNGAMTSRMFSNLSHHHCHHTTNINHCLHRHWQHTNTQTFYDHYACQPVWWVTRKYWWSTCYTHRSLLTAFGYGEDAGILGDVTYTVSVWYQFNTVTDNIQNKMLALPGKQSKFISLYSSQGISMYFKMWILSFNLEEIKECHLLSKINTMWSMFCICFT